MSLSVRHKQNAGLRIAVNVSPRHRTCVPVKCRQRLAERRRGHYCKYPSAYLPKAVHRFCQKPSIPGRKTTRALSQTSVLVSPYSGTPFLPKSVHARQKDDADITASIRPRICPKRYIVSAKSRPYPAERRREHYHKHPSSYLPKAVHRFCPTLSGKTVHT